MMKTLFKTIIFGIAVFALIQVEAQEVVVKSKQKRADKPAIELGAEITHEGKDGEQGRGLKQHLIIPKGEWQIGAQLSHVSLSSDNSEYMLLVNGLNANASITKIAPFFAYSYRNNRSVGVKFQYTTASGCIDKGELDLLSDDLNFSVSNISAELSSMQMSVYHRSYLGLDNKGRIGVFADVALGYANRKNVFSYNEQTKGIYSRSHQLKLSLHPGIVVFAMNNVSTHVSMGIGGVSYNHTNLIEGGVKIGSRDYSQAKFKLDILDISIGVSIHL